MNMKRHARRFGTLVFGFSALLAAAAAAQGTGETYKATASVKSPTATASTPVTIRILRFVTDAERAAIVKAVQTNDAAATKKALEVVADVGYIEVGAKRTPLKYAYARTTGSGRMITVVTAKPVAYVGASAPGAKPKGEYELALA